MPVKDIRPFTHYLDKKLGELNVYTHRWAPHILIFSSAYLYVTLHLRPVRNLPYDLRWASRRTTATWCSLGAVVCYCNSEAQRFRRQIDTDSELRKIEALRDRVVTRDWQKIPLSFSGDHLLPLVGNEDEPISFGQRAALFSSRMTSSDASRSKYTALLRPEVIAGRIGTQDYDLCITALANKRDSFAFWRLFTASVSTIGGLGLLLLAIPRTRTAARRLPWAIMFGPIILVASSALYHNARIPTEFSDRQNVIRIMEEVMAGTKT